MSAAAGAAVGGSGPWAAVPITSQAAAERDVKLVWPAQVQVLIAGPLPACQGQTGWLQGHVREPGYPRS